MSTTHTTDILILPNEFEGHDYVNRYGARVRTAIEWGERVIYGFDGQVCTWELRFSHGTPAAVHAAALGASVDEIKKAAA